MAVIHSPTTSMHGQEPPSPSLTNPDMILPFERPESRESTPTPTFDSTLRNGNNVQQSETSTLSSMMGRPSMPGDWQTETDIHGATSNDAAESREQGQETDATSRISKELRRVSANSAKAGEGRALNGASSPLTGERVSPVSSTGSGERDPFSQLAFLKAEEILANAKKRLTTMENNLTRARSISMGRSMSAASNNIEDSPSNSPRIGSRGNNWAISAAKLRQTGFTGSAAHSRVVSETSVPSKPTFGGRRFESDGTRSSSAMGMKEMEAKSQTPERGYGPARFLEPLQEDELAASNADESELRESPPPTSNKSRVSSISPSGTSKARQSIQLRDLREQMADLQGKIHSLKLRTREDTMHRRSMQMLRSPNPFTDANSRDQSPQSQKSPEPSDKYLKVGGLTNNKANSEGQASTVFDDVSMRSSPNTASKMTPMTDNDLETFTKEDTAEPSKEESSAGVVGQEELPPPSKLDRFDPASPHSLQAEFLNIEDESERTSPVETSDKRDSGQVSNSTVNKQDDDANFSASSSALSSPRTSVSDPGSPTLPAPAQVISHEDRPDAFDYETFVLNSAMGSFSRQGIETSSASSGSTIGPGESGYQQPNFIDARSQLSLVDDNGRPRTANSRRGYHDRRGSDASVSTVATFATATSGDGGMNGISGANGTGRIASRAASRTASRAHSRTTSRTASRVTHTRGVSPTKQHPSPPSQSYTSNSSRPLSSSFPRPGSGSLYYPSYNQPKLYPTKRSSLSPTNETSVAARSQILSALLADPLGSPRASPEALRGVRMEDEALLRAVIEGLQRVSGRLRKGEDVRGILEGCRRVLDGSYEEIMEEDDNGVD